MTTVEKIILTELMIAGPTAAIGMPLGFGYVFFIGMAGMLAGLCAFAAYIVYDLWI